MITLGMGLLHEFLQKFFSHSLRDATKRSEMIIQMRHLNYILARYNALHMSKEMYHPGIS